MTRPTPIEYYRSPYEAREAWLQYIALARLGVLAFLTLGVTFNPGPLGRAIPLLLYLVGFATSAAHLRALRRPRHLTPQATLAQVLLDFTLVAVTVFFTEGPTSFYTLIFVIVVLEAGLLLGPSQGFILSSLAAAFMFLQLIAPPPGFEPRPTLELVYNFLVQTMAFYLTAFISGYWNQRINRMQQFQTEILDNMNSGFIITDPAGIVTVQNRAASQILGIPEGAAVGRPVAEVLRVESGGECPVLTALRSGTDFTSYEFRAITGKKRSRLLGLTTSRMTDGKGRVTGIIASFTDLTAMDEMRQEVRRQDRMAVVGELAAGLAHEIRNPVAIIRGAVEELGAKTGHDPLQTQLSSIALRESDHLNDIVSSFLDFARQPSMKREVLDVRGLIHEVRALLEREAGAAGVTIGVICPEEPCLVSADPSQLKQVFINLGKNAIEAMDGAGALRLKITNGPGPVEIRFDDTGPGIPPDQVARIFEPFYTTKRNGVGMGLAVCQRIITAHDGAIRPFSREGGGCSMVVSLPPVKLKD